MSNFVRYQAPRGSDPLGAVYVEVYNAPHTEVWDHDTGSWVALGAASDPRLSLTEVDAAYGIWTGELGQLGTLTGTVYAFTVLVDGSLLDTQALVLANGLRVQPGDIPQVPLYEHTGGTDALRITDDDGVALEGAVIRVFRSSDPPTAAPLGATHSLDTGGWACPIYVAPGAYRVHVSYPGAATASQIVVV